MGGQILFIYHLSEKKLPVWKKLNLIGKKIITSFFRESKKIVPGGDENLEYFLCPRDKLCVCSSVVPLFHPFRLHMIVHSDYTWSWIVWLSPRTVFELHIKFVTGYFYIWWRCAGPKDFDFREIFWKLVIVTFGHFHQKWGYMACLAISLYSFWTTSKKNFAGCFYT